MTDGRWGSPVGLTPCQWRCASRWGPNRESIDVQTVNSGPRSVITTVMCSDGLMTQTLSSRREARVGRSEGSRAARTGGREAGAQFPIICALSLHRWSAASSREPSGSQPLLAGLHIRSLSRRACQALCSSESLCPPVVDKMQNTVLPLRENVLECSGTVLSKCACHGTPGWFSQWSVRLLILRS